SGLEFSDDGSLVPVNDDRRSKLTKQLEQLAQGLGPNARFIRWFFSTGGDRTIFPASDAKIGEWVDNALLTNPNITEEWVRNAWFASPIIHCCISRWRGLKPTLSALTFFAYSCCRGYRET